MSSISIIEKWVAFAGSGQEIIEPSALRELRPEVIVLMNPIYREEIGSALRARGLDPELLVA